MDNASLGINRLRDILQRALSAKDWADVSGRNSCFTETVRDAYNNRKLSRGLFGKLAPAIPARILADALYLGGWEMLGAGHFGLVMKHADYPELAFKFSHKPADAYMQYAMWARDNAGLSPHLPVVHDIYKCDDFVLFALDELERISHDEYDDMQLVVLERAARSGDWPEYGVDEELEDLVVLSIRIGEFFRGVATIDLHSDNVMRCPKTGCVIITDPVSFTNRRIDGQES